MQMQSKTEGPVLTFGIENEADVMASDIDTSRLGSIQFRLQTPVGEAAAKLPMTGGHNLMNALAAAAVATALKIKPERSRMRWVRPGRRRCAARFWISRRDSRLWTIRTTRTRVR